MLRYIGGLAFEVVLVGQLLVAQSTASLSGHIFSEEGRTLRAAVTLSFAGPRGFPSPPRRVFTGANGTFTFSRLPAGKYTICAQVLGVEPAPVNSPYVDTCAWGSPLAPIALAAGQQAAGINFTASKGAWLQVRVNDPDHILPQTSAKGPAPLAPELQLTLQGPDGLVHPARFVSADATGRNYRLAVPLKMALNLQVTSSVGDVFNQQGTKLKNTDQSTFQPTAASDLGQVTFTVHKKSQ